MLPETVPFPGGLKGMRETITIIMLFHKVTSYVYMASHTV